MTPSSELMSWEAVNCSQSGWAGSAMIRFGALGTAPWYREVSHCPAWWGFTRKRISGWRKATDCVS